MSSHTLKALCLGLALGGPLSQATASEGDYANPHLIVSTSELAQLIESDAAVTPVGKAFDLRVIDTRSRDKFLAGHLPGAVNIPYTRLTDPSAHVPGALKSDGALARIFGRRGIDSNAKVVIYDDEGGFRASRLFWVLEYFGHRDVSLLNGGIQTWVGEGRPLNTANEAGLAKAVEGSAPKVETRFAVNLAPRRYASADYILERRDDEETVVVDVRPETAFVKGHIPWAINLPWKGNLTADGTIKSAEALKARYEAAGITADKNIVIHCQTGEASAHSYFTLRLLGHPRVRTYHRSWAEWGASDDLPKAVPTEG